MSAIKTLPPMIGDVFEDRHADEQGRRTKLIELCELDAGGRQGLTAETIRNDAQPHLVGRQTKIAVHVLQKGFVKIV